MVALDRHFWAWATGQFGSTGDTVHACTLKNSLHSSHMSELLYAAVPELLPCILVVGLEGLVGLVRNLYVYINKLL